VLFKDKKSEISNKHRLEETTDFIFIKDKIPSDFNFSEHKTTAHSPLNILQFSEKEVSDMLDNLPDLVLKIHSNGNIVYCNDKNKHLNLIRDDIIGKNLSEIFHPLTHLQFVEAIDNVQKNNLTQIFEFQQYEHGELREYESRLNVVQNDSEFVAIIRDISEQKRSEITLRKNEKKLRTLFESAAHSMIVINTYGKIELVNTACEKMFGYNKNELFDKTFEVLIPEKYCQKYDENFINFFSKKENKKIDNKMEVYGRHKDGSMFPIEIRISPQEIHEDNFVIASIIDITSRKILEPTQKL
jgi:PAS domain S-box-containing protein